MPSYYPRKYNKADSIGAVLLAVTDAEAYWKSSVLCNDWIQLWQYTCLLTQAVFYIMRTDNHNPIDNWNYHYVAMPMYGLLGVSFFASFGDIRTFRESRLTHILFTTWIGAIGAGLGMWMAGLQNNTSVLEHIGIYVAFSAIFGVIFFKWLTMLPPILACLTHMDWMEVADEDAEGEPFEPRRVPDSRISTQTRPLKKQSNTTNSNSGRDSSKKDKNNARSRSSEAGNRNRGAEGAPPPTGAVAVRMA